MAGREWKRLGLSYRNASSSSMARSSNRYRFVELAVLAEHLSTKNPGSDTEQALRRVPSEKRMESGAVFARESTRSR